MTVKFPTRYVVPYWFGTVRADHYDLPDMEPDLIKFRNIFDHSEAKTKPFSETFSKQMDEMAQQANEIQYEMDEELKKFGRVSKKTMCCFKDGIATINSFMEMFSDLTPKSLVTPEAREIWFQNTEKRCREMFRTLVKIDKLCAEIPPRGFEPLFPD